MKELQRITIATEQWQAAGIDLTSEQNRYLRRVLRLNVGDRLVVIGEQPIAGSRWWLAALTVNGASPIEPLPEPIESGWRVTLVAALPKGSGFDEVVRQATELGVAEIWPVLSDRTVLQPNANRLDRWRRIAREAAEQAERATIPPIADPRSWAEAIAAAESTYPRYLCVARRSVPHLLHCLQAHPPTDPHSSIVLAIGPEGGWTPDEVTQAERSGWQLVSLGPQVLRAVTAPLAALAVIAAASERA
ncbi:MAG: 16S rRNA (uracil(1498)-N(3))-methyltransferase [Oscillatoriales cyanobacterium]|nr:MAG: 16S rRNA (uracil(1498)-N(3))-methyltransferase [Oscillatoriales cyanobacterium]